MAFGSAAEAARLETLDEVEACIRANRPEHSLVQQYSMVTVDRIGSKRTNKGEMYWKRFDGDLQMGLVRVKGPPDLRGSALLMVHREKETDLFSYLPELGRVRRVNQRSVSGQFLGSDFTYEDFERLQSFGRSAQSELLPPAEIEGRAAYVVSGKPAYGTNSEYSRVVSYIDQKTCVPVRTEAFDQRNRLLKTFSTPPDQISREGERWIPKHVLVVNEQSGTRTTLEIHKIELDVHIPDHQFSQGALIRRR